MKKLICLIVILLSQSVYAYHQNMEQVFDNLIKHNIKDKELVKNIRLLKKSWEDFKYYEAKVLFYYHDGSAVTECKTSLLYSLDKVITQETNYWYYTTEGDVCWTTK